jgi:hypothetical protein
MGRGYADVLGGLSPAQAPRRERRRQNGYALSGHHSLAQTAALVSKLIGRFTQRDNRKDKKKRRREDSVDHIGNGTTVLVQGDVPALSRYWFALKRLENAVKTRICAQTRATFETLPFSKKMHRSATRPCHTAVDINQRQRRNHGFRHGQRLCDRIWWIARPVRPATWPSSSPATIC